MGKKQDITSNKERFPQIYAYIATNLTDKEGWTKIGYTTEEKVEKRIKSQTHTAQVIPELKWAREAKYKYHPYNEFMDHAFHAFLVKEKKVERAKGSEYFHVDSNVALNYFNYFVNFNHVEYDDYKLRPEQEEAINKTLKYFQEGGDRFLWNAKPRFGKTLAAYELIKRAGYKNVLVVSNRPSISNSWAQDYGKFFSKEGNQVFISDTPEMTKLSKTDSLLRGLVLTWKAFKKKGELKDKNRIFFESLQGLKSAKPFDGKSNKLWHLASGKHVENGHEYDEGLEFDLLIVDEAHEGVQTFQTTDVLEKIARKHTLYLSGTPFRIIESGEFSNDQIYSWTYLDEQNAKKEWYETSESSNPYENLPKMKLFTYRLSDEMVSKVREGGDTPNGIPGAFSLGELFHSFKDKDGEEKFIHETEVKSFLKLLFEGDNFPFSTPDYRRELSHTLWRLDRVDSVKALKKLMQDMEEFDDYNIVVAAGNDVKDSDEKIVGSYKAVRKAIDQALKNTSTGSGKTKTITLSVGQLTVGVTFPEWSGVFMLCNLSTATAYLQTAFRAQTPHCFRDSSSHDFRKETAYIFDFDPARTLDLYGEFANQFCCAAGRSGDSRTNIRELLNFMPVYCGKDSGGMEELDAERVVTIPLQLKTQNVIQSRFQSGFLFQNIPALLQNPSEQVIAVLDQMIRFDGHNSPGNVKPRKIEVGKFQSVFGSELYGEIIATIKSKDQEFESKLKQQINAIEHAVQEIVNNEKKKALAEYDGVDEIIAEDLENLIAKEVANKAKDSLQKLKVTLINNHREYLFLKAGTYSVAKIDKKVEDDLQKELKEFEKEVILGLSEKFKERLETLGAKRKEHDKKQKDKKEQQKQEEELRQKLQSLTGVIPCFVLAYGKNEVDGEPLRLGNLEKWIDPTSFEEITKITMEDFRTLCKVGKVFNETLFDASIVEFQKKRVELANYFSNNTDESIFDYIPSPRSNQVFTPKSIVKLMLDKLEEESPGCFDDPEHTFADLYMKSGQYLAEVAKRLFNSPKMRELLPNDAERILHILSKQIYGMSPDSLLHKVAVNYILGFNITGFDENMRKDCLKHLVMADVTEVLKDNDSRALEKMINRYFDSGEPATDCKASMDSNTEDPHSN